MEKLILLVSTLLIVACQQSNVTTEAESIAQNTPETLTDVNTEVVKSKNVANVETAEIPTAPMAKIASNSIKFTYSTATERAQVGLPFDIEIDFENFSGSEYAAEFKPTPGLQLASTNRAVINASEKGVSNSHKITVVPQAEGIYFLNVYQVGAVDQKPSAIKIVVGDKDIREYMQTIGEIVETEDGSKVVSMKADEG